jgi:hypothetical protein
MDLATDTVTFLAQDANTAITAEGSVFIATTFLRLAGIDQLPLLDLSGGEFSKAVIATGASAGINLEIAMMLDVTGSMSGQKIKDLKVAAKDLVNITVWADQSEYTSRVSIVPFANGVRPPSSAMVAARGPLPGEKNVTYGGSTIQYKLTECMAERTGPEKYTDAPPESGQYVMGVYTTSGACSLSSADEVLPLSSDKSNLLDHIEDLVLAGSTAGHLGTAWAWYTLSPSWNSVWNQASSHAVAYGTPDTQKIAILMTDGEYNTQFDAAGIRTGSPGAGAAANGSSNVQAKALCESMKQKGITVYTVGFALGGNATAIETLKSCASDPGKFYDVEDGDQLKQAFRDIALRLSALYLSR